MGKDIAYLKTTLRPDISVLEKVSAWRLINWIMLVILGVSILFASVGRKSLAQKRAYATARGLLKKAQSDEAVAEAVSGYLQQKMKISTGSLPLKGIVASLHKHGVTPATSEAFSLLWQRLDTARFAPGAPDAQNGQELASQALDILKLLEEESK